MSRELFPHPNASSTFPKIMEDWPAVAAPGGMIPHLPEAALDPESICGCVDRGGKALPSPQGEHKDSQASGSFTNSVCKALLIQGETGRLSTHTRACGQAQSLRGLP